MRELFMTQTVTRSGIRVRRVCCQAAAHPSDINCVRWHPIIPGLLASAGDDGCIRLWRLGPEASGAG